MINTYLRDRRLYSPVKLKHNDPIDSLIKSRNLFSIQTIDYDLTTVTSLDIDESNNFMLVGLSNGAIDLQEIEDPTYGTLGAVARFNFSRYNVNRVQWSPGGVEQFFSFLDNHSLYLADPVEMRVLDRYDFSLKTNWSEWNPNDNKMIAVCGSESQVRLVDVRSGSAVQTVILSAPSRLATHRATRCLWSKLDLNCLIVGDNEGYLHVYDTRQSSKPYILAGEERGQISGMSFTRDNCSIITCQGTENQPVQWMFDKCTLKPYAQKFKKPKKEVEIVETMVSNNTKQNSHKRARGSNGTIFQPSSSKSGTPTCPDKARQIVQQKKQKKRAPPLPVDAYIRCQFHVTDRHLYCPVPASTKKSKEIYIYDLDSGARIKTLKSDDILSKGVYSVSSLLPESLVIYVGGRGRLRAWSIDEGHQQRMEEKMRRYHQTTWDSDEGDA